MENQEDKNNQKNSTLKPLIQGAWFLLILFGLLYGAPFLLSLEIVDPAQIMGVVLVGLALLAILNVKEAEEVVQKNKKTLYLLVGVILIMILFSAFIVEEVNSVVTKVIGEEHGEQFVERNKEIIKFGLYIVAGVVISLTAIFNKNP